MKILLTGGTGRLGQALLQLPGALLVPSRTLLNILLPGECRNAIYRARPDLVLHCAAYTQTWKAEGERDLCWRTNVDGTRNLAGPCANIGSRLVYISTDAVFRGDRGGYSVDDAPDPMNFYAQSKWHGEREAERVANHLIIRTSLRPRPWPYPQAPMDAFTSGDYVDVIAPLVLDAALSERRGLFHLGTGRKSFFELAQQTNPDVKPCYRSEMAQPPAIDLSLT